jgi:hypothetical protein
MVNEQISEKRGNIDITVYQGRNIIPMDDTGTQYIVNYLHLLKEHQILMFEYMMKHKALKLRRELISNPTH